MPTGVLDLHTLPRFGASADGKEDVTLAARDWARVLVRLDCTDPALWPPALAAGAGLLSRIRLIEADCISAHGGFDWEKLTPELQDEYDGTCADLTLLLTADDEWVDLETFRAELGLEVA